MRTEPPTGALDGARARAHAADAGVRWECDQGGPADVLIGDGLHATVIRLLLFLYFCRSAYYIRLHAIEEYGLVIHEFDPWFNYRATEYLAEHGSEKFFKWYDYMSWYPLGRPVGTTIYPGMQITSVTIWNVLNSLGVEISLNDVCCYVPAWFGVSATVFLTALTYECTGSANGAVAAAGIMSVVPAHIMRSVGGGYDNESVAMTAMCCTFFWWCRSLRSNSSWPLGIVAGIAYIYMAAAWGGYIFVINMVAVHALGLMATGRYSNKLHHAYTLFYIVGTYGESAALARVHTLHDTKLRTRNAQMIQRCCLSRPDIWSRPQVLCRCL